MSVNYEYNEWNETKRSKVYVPIWMKYTLSIEEASAYFRIGESRLRNFLADHLDADFIFMNGNRIQIKRKMFEHFIDTSTTI